MNGKRGNIIIPADVVPWPHELRTARVLAKVGFTVEFISTSSIRRADILLDGVEFEIKAPITDKANTLEHTLKRALHQSPNIIIDSRRTDGKRLSDKQIRNFLISKARQHRQIKRLLFVTRNGQVIDIKELI